MKKIIIFSFISLVTCFSPGPAFPGNIYSMHQHPVTIDNNAKRQQSEAEKDMRGRQLKESQKELNKALNRWATQGRSGS